MVSDTLKLIRFVFVGISLPSKLVKVGAGLLPALLRLAREVTARVQPKAMLVLSENGEKFRGCNPEKNNNATMQRLWTVTFIKDAECNNIT